MDPIEICCQRGEIWSFAQGGLNMEGKFAMLCRKGWMSGKMQEM